jgi:CheY-like chemotaxis protein
LSIMVFLPEDRPMVTGRTTRILVVEDDRDSADCLVELLRIWGFAPSVARNGRAALLAVLGEPFDVILLDLGMPIVDGYEVARQIATSGGPGQRPFLVAISGYSANTSRETGIDLHLVKPVAPDQLLAVLLRFEAVVRN